MMAAMADETAPPVDPELLETAVRIANLAAEVTLFHFRHDDLTVDHKGDGTPVGDPDESAGDDFSDGYYDDPRAYADDPAGAILWSFVCVLAFSGFLAVTLIVW